MNIINYIKNHVRIIKYRYQFWNGYVMFADSDNVLIFIVLEGHTLFSINRFIFFITSIGL